MTVAAGIEIVPGGHPESGEVHASGKALGAAAEGAGGFAAAGPASFRSGWQSLLASLGTGADGLSGTGADTGGALAANENVPGEAAEKAHAAGSTAAAVAGRATLQGNKSVAQGSGLGTDRTALNSSGLPDGIRGGRTAAEAMPGTAAVPVAKSQGDGESTRSAKDSHSASRARREKLEAASADAALPAASGLGETALAVPLVVSPAPGANAAKIHDESAEGSLALSKSAFDLGGTPFGLADAARAPKAVGGKAASVSGKSDSTNIGGEPVSEFVAGNGANDAGESEPVSGSDSSQAVGGMRASVVQGDAVRASQIQSQASGLEAETASVPRAMNTLEGQATVAAGANAHGAQPSMTPQVAAKPVSAGNARGSVRGTSGADLAGNRNRLVEGQLGAAAVDGTNAALTRNSAVVHGGIGTPANSGGGSAGAAASRDGQTARDTFTALDAETAPGTTAWIHAGSQRAEAGYQDPVLGWVGVRADASGAGVHASVVPGSADAAQALGGHLAGLNAYLAEHHTQVETVTLAAPEGHTAGLGADESAGRNMQQGSGQGAEQDTGQQAASQSNVPEFAPAVSRENIPAQAIESSATATTGAFGSGHISVMA
jgi:hypothetical protein